MFLYTFFRKKRLVVYSKNGTRSRSNFWAPSKSHPFAISQTISWVHVVPIKMYLCNLLREGFSKVNFITFA